MDKGAFSILGFCAWAGIGRSKAYGEIASGHIKALKVGKRTLITIAEAQRWLESLEPAEIGNNTGQSTSLPENTPPLAQTCKAATAPEPASTPGERTTQNESDITLPHFLDRRSKEL